MNNFICTSSLVPGKEMSINDTIYVYDPYPDLYALPGAINDLTYTVWPPDPMGALVRLGMFLLRWAINDIMRPTFEVTGRNRIKEMRGNLGI